MSEATTLVIVGIALGINLGALFLNLMYKKYHIIKINLAGVAATALIMLITCNFIIN